MKTNLLFIADVDPESAKLARNVARQTGRGVLRARSAREAIRILEDGIPEVDAIVIDVDPGMHGLALLEAISGTFAHPPVVVVTALEEAYMRPIAKAHGAAACIGKPFTTERLASVIAEVSAEWHPSLPTCDLWGHPHRSCDRSKGDAELELSKT